MTFFAQTATLKFTGLWPNRQGDTLLRWMMWVRVPLGQPLTALNPLLHSQPLDSGCRIGMVGCLTAHLPNYGCRSAEIASIHGEIAGFDTAQTHKSPAIMRLFGRDSTKPTTTRSVVASGRLDLRAEPGRDGSNDSC